MTTFFADRFRSFCAAQYGVADPTELPDRQRLEAEDAFMAGASAGFYQGFGCTDLESVSAHNELTSFGKRILERYEAAGLPLGARRS
jgi:hypothetical protein